jgi:hypothetical protein
VGGEGEEGCQQNWSSRQSVARLFLCFFAQGIFSHIFADSKILAGNSPAGPPSPVIAMIATKDRHFRSRCCHNFKLVVKLAHVLTIIFSFSIPLFALTLHKVTAAALYLSMPEAI